MYSLLLAISGGRDWELLADEISVVHSSFKLFFAAYVVFVVFGVLNVVIGVFVHRTQQVKLHDKDLAVQEEMELSRSFVKELRELLTDHGLPHNAKLTWDALEQQLQRREVQMYLQTHRIDVGEAEELFNLIDADREGVVQLDDFVYGCQRMKGEAKAMDIVLLYEEVTHINSTVREYHDRLTGLTREVKDSHELVFTAMEKYKYDILYSIEDLVAQMNELHDDANI
jgi:Ca2+-binding EF-hand superfamily protein